MNKSLLLLATALFTIAPCSLGQTPEGFGGIPGIPLSEKSPELVRFDLDFPGGTPGELAARISKATGKHLNIVIPTAYAKTDIMPIKVEKVTVPDLFRAIEMASTRQVPQVTSSGPKGQISVQYKTTALRFQANSKKENDETIWSFQSTGSTEEEERLLARAVDQPEPEQVCQYFQLAPYLQDHTVEDVTTAIRTGWKMLKIEPTPQLSFHQETKLLIAVGAAPHVAQIPQVLQQLPLDNSTAIEKIAKLQSELDDLEAKKAGDWEKQAQAAREKIGRVVRAQRARETLQDTRSFPMGVPRPPQPVGR